MAETRKRTRANGEGSYRPRGKLGNSIEFRWGDAENKKTLTEPRNGRTEKELRDRLIELRGQPVAFDPRIKFVDLAQEWYVDLENRVQDNTLEESTYYGYQYTLDTLKRLFEGDIFIELTAKKIDKKIASAKKKMRGDVCKKFEVSDERYSKETQSKLRTMLCQIFAYGVLTDRIKPENDPMRYVPKIRSNERKKPEKKAYTESEVVKLLKDLPYTRVGYAARVCLACSFRGQELLMIMADDISEDGSEINIEKAIKRGRYGYYDGNTKTEASDRTTDVPQPAWPWAKWLRDHAANGYIMPDESKTGRLRSAGHLSLAVWRKRYYKAVKAAGVEPLTPHKMRHTATTGMRTRAGIDGKIVAAINGQSDQATMEGYNHVDRDAKKKAAKEYGQYLQDIMDGKEYRKPTTFKVLSFGQRMGKSEGNGRSKAN